MFVLKLTANYFSRADCCVSDPPTYAPGESHLPHKPGLSEFGKVGDFYFIFEKWKLKTICLRNEMMPLVAAGDFQLAFNILHIFHLTSSLFKCNSFCVVYLFSTVMGSLKRER